MFDVSGGIRIPLTSDDYIALMRRARGGREIGREGIQVGNRMYDSSELDGLRLKPSADKRMKYKWEVRYSPYEVSRVWVKNPETDQWITCLRKDKDIWRRPFSVHIYALGRQSRLERDSTLDAELKERNRQLRRAAKREAITLRQWEKRRNLVKQQEERSGVPLPQAVPEGDVNTDETLSPDLRQPGPGTRLGQFDPKETPF